MARVGGGTCLLSPGVTRLGPRRGGFGPGLTTPSPSLKILAAVPGQVTLGRCFALHRLRPAARFSVGSSSAYLVDLYHFDAPVCPEDSIVSRHRLGFQSLCNPRGKNLLEFLRFEAVNVVVNQTLNP